MRKIWPEKLFDGYRLRENVVLLVREDGLVEGIVPLEEAGDGIEQFAGLLTPGFVNCHCHLELSHMKGKVPEGTGLVDFVFKIVTERSATAEEIADAIEKAEAEMKQEGIVAVGDICNNNSTVVQKTKGNLRYYNFIEASGWLPGIAEGRFTRAKGLYEELQDVEQEWGIGDWESGIGKEESGIGGERKKLRDERGELRTLNSIVPHAPYSVSEALWERIQPWFEGKVVSIHNQETAFEDEFFLKGTGDFTRMYELMKIDNSHHLPTGKTSLKSYYDKLLGADKIILVHNTYTGREDVEYVRQQTGIRGRELGIGNWEGKSEDVRSERGEGIKGSQVLSALPATFFCLCVNANWYIERKMPPVELLRENGCAIVLGTDSLASNRSLSILDEMKTIRKNFPGIPLEEMLGWATINGARALNMEEKLGSFEKGKRPGLVLVNETELEVMRVLL